MRWLKYLLSVVILLLAAYGGSQLWPEDPAPVNVYPLTDFNQNPDGIVGFQSYTPHSAQAIAAGPADQPVQIGGGLLVMPAGASADKPVPAVVILHGSGGDWTGRSIYLANRLARNGIAGFAVDTFKARNLRATDDYYTRLKKAPVYAQIADAYGALLALQQHPYIQADQIAVTGFSLGAAAALYTMFEPIATSLAGERGPRFSAYASFYAGCSFDFESFQPEGSPVLLMMGAKDESMDISRCEWLEKKLQQHRVDARLIVYPEAGHGWEQPYPMAFVEGASVTKNCIIQWTNDNQSIELTSGKNIDTTLGAIMAFSQCATKDGYTQGLHLPTREQSFADLLAFLKQNVHE